MGLASEYNDTASLLVHALEQQEGEEPMAEIVRGEDGVQPIIRPRLIAEILEAGAVDEGTDRWNFTRGHSPLLCMSLKLDSLTQG